jgi:hypothetical protein
MYHFHLPCTIFKYIFSLSFRKFLVEFLIKRSNWHLEQISKSKLDTIDFEKYVLSNLCDLNNIGLKN